MKIGGLKFPYDHERDVSHHGPVCGFLMRTHPFAIWIPAILISMILGLVLPR